MQIVEQAVVGTGSLDDTLLTQFHTRCLGQDRSPRREVLARAGARVLQVQYQSIQSADLSDFKDSRAQTVVWPSSLASGALIYPYAGAKRNV